MKGSKVVTILLNVSGLNKEEKANDE